MSRTTLKVCGGVPKEISEKSAECEWRWRGTVEAVERAQHTLSIQEIVNGHWMRAIGDVGSFEDLLHVRLGLETHVLLAEAGDMLLNVCILLLAVRTSSAGGCACRDGGDDGGDDDLQAVQTRVSS